MASAPTILKQLSALGCKKTFRQRAGAIIRLTSRFFFPQVVCKCMLLVAETLFSFLSWKQLFGGQGHRGLLSAGHPDLLGQR